MKVTVNRFRQYLVPTTWVLPERGIGLLSGPSGHGKTTVLEATAWCLYGGLTQIYPAGAAPTEVKSNPTWVRLEFNGIIIQRSKVPTETIQVSVAEGIFEGDTAQGYIDRIFGTKGLWGVSYLRQGQRCTLMTAPNVERFNLLGELTYGIDPDAGPDKSLEKVEARLTEVRNYLTPLAAKCSTYKEHRDFLATRSEVAVKLWASRGTASLDLPALTAEVTRTRDLLTTTRQQEQAHQTAMSLQRQRVQQRETLTTQLVPLEELQQRRDALLTQTAALQTYTEVANRRRELESRLAQLPSVVPKHDRVQLEDAMALHRQYQALGTTPGVRKTAVLDLESQLRTYHEQLAALTSWTDVAKLAETAWHRELTEWERCRDAATQAYRHQLAAYEATQRQAQLEQRLYEQALANYTKLQQEHQIYTLWLEADSKARSELKVKLEQYQADFGEVEVNTTIVELQDQLRELHCPHCNMGITLRGQTLLKGRSTPTQQEQLRQQLKSVLDYRHLLDQVAKPRVAPAALPSMPVPPTPVSSERPVVPIEGLRPVMDPLPLKPTITLSAPQRLALEKQVQTLQSLAEPSLTLEEATQGLAALETQRQRQNLQSQLDGLPELTPPPEKGTETATLAQLQSHLEYQQSLRGQLQAVAADLPIPEGPPAGSDSVTLQAQLQVAETALQQSTQLVEAGRQVAEIEAWTKSYEEHWARVTEYTEYQKNLQRLKALISETSAAALESVVAQINETLRVVLRDLFTDEIQVKLLTHRQLKTKEEVKLQVGLEILYRDVKYSTSSQLSGGEQDRISLALTIAVAKLHTNPILLLDECMAALDAGLRERCLKALRLHLPHKTVVHICHETIEGFHDAVLRC